MNLSIILPAYNEVGSLPTLIEQIINTLGKIKYEILIVDDNSSDGSGRVIKDRFGKIHHIHLIVNPTRIGLARSILKGIKASHGTHILIMDSDFNHHPRYIQSFLSKCVNYDVIIGSRYIKGGGMENKRRQHLSFLYNVFIRLILKLPTHDNLSGFFLVRKKILEQLPLNKIFNGYGDYFIRFLYHAHKKRFRLLEIPVHYEKRIAGYSKSRLLEMAVTYSRTIFEIKKHEK